MIERDFDQEPLDDRLHEESEYERLYEENLELKAERDVFYEDVRELCRVLGLPDGAQPVSTREVMRGCIERARQIVAPMSRTIDGVPVGPGAKIYEHFTCFEYEVSSLYPDTSVRKRNDGDTDHAMVRDCFSTHEMAKANRLAGGSLDSFKECLG